MIIKKIFIIVLSLTVSYAFAQTQTFTKTLQVGKGGKLELKITKGDVSINTWERDEFSIQVKGLSENDAKLFKINHHGKDVEIISNFKKRGEYKAEINVPSHYNLDIATSAGSIELRGSLVGEATLKTSGGHINVENVNGELTAKTHGGHINVENAIGDALLSTNGGHIVVNNVFGNLNVVTLGGNIEIGYASKYIDAKTSGGNIEINSALNGGKIITSGGNIRLKEGNGVLSLKTAGGDIIANTVTGSIEALTSGGDISLHNVTGSVNAKTSAGTIKVELIPDGKSNSDIVNHAGDIELLIPEYARASVNARIKVSGWFSNKNKVSEYFKSDYKKVSVKQDEVNRELHCYLNINNGGQTINISTSSGAVAIRKLK